WRRANVRLSSILLLLKQTSIWDGTTILRETSTARLRSHKLRSKWIRRLGKRFGSLDGHTSKKASMMKPSRYTLAAGLCRRIMKFWHGLATPTRFPEIKFKRRSFLLRSRMTQRECTSRLIGKL